MVLKRTQRDDEDCLELRKLLTVEAEELGQFCRQPAVMMI